MSLRPSQSVLRIADDVLERIWRHAHNAHPMEACGIVTSEQRHVPIRNCSPRPMIAYQFAPEAQLEAWQDMRDNDEMLLAIYHSHTSRDARPSGTDHALAVYSGAYYLIVSTHDHTARAFTLQNELSPALVEVPLEVVPSISQG